MPEPRLLIVGSGDIGRRLAPLLLAAGWNIHALRRQPETADDGICWHRADYTEPGSLRFVEALAPDYLLTTLTPASREVEGYLQGFATATKNLLAGLGASRPRRIIMVSSTRVYAESNGGWIDESAPLSTTDPRAVAIIDAEQHLFQASFPATVVRFGGIYGAPGGRLLKKVQQGRISPATPVRYTNRIHRDDCAGFLAHLLLRDRADQTVLDSYNGVDDCPCPAHEVEAWLARQLGITPLTQDTATAATVSHKRCKNTALKSSGYSLRYPDYKAGYASLLQASVGHGAAD
ncbi:NAD(P)H-binding protein [Seongchinamella sediminis]|uniref:NAD(P)H-binding protein n=1 Tax=Seongchinamella sediminis TaxID=2283635 RepID=UPI0013C30168|nr:NAD(P)H-binding protein [Seongchinamella sediminis]